MVCGERWLFLFVDIGGMLEHHCLKSLLINQVSQNFISDSN
jgi:hypothetical protein